MPDPLLVSLSATAIFVVAAVAQAVSGFGAALVAIPLLAVVVDPVTAVVAATGVSLVLSSMAWRRERAHVEVAMARRLTVGGVLAMPLGLLVLLVVTEHTLRLVISGLILVSVVALAVRVHLPASASAQWGAGALSGALLTSTGMNGPPLVLSVQGAGLPARTARATLQTVFAVQDVVAVAGFAVLGLVTGEVLLCVAGGCLAAPLGWAVGDRIFHRLSPETFRRVVLVGLTTTALVSMAQAVVG